MEVIERIAAAAATGMVLSMRAPRPRGPEQWVRQCTEAADAAASELRNNPPEVLRKETTWERWSREVEANVTDSRPEMSMQPMTGPELDRAVIQAASQAFRASMPLITGRAATKAYIACVAAGSQRGFFTDGEARALLYNCQLALAAWKPRSSDAAARRPKRGQAG